MIDSIETKDTLDASISGKHFEDAQNHVGIFSIVNRGKDGAIKEVRLVKNLITSAGKAGLASRIGGAGAEAAFTYLAMGTGVTAANIADTTLQTELATSGLSRANSTTSRVTTTVTNDTAQLLNTFSVTGTVAVTECGILNAASAGTLLSRQVFSAINVVNTDNLQITYKVACT